MSYSALANPASPYPALAQSKPPGKKTDARIDKFHALLLNAAQDVASNDAIIGSYKRFQQRTSATMWYFTKVSILDGATARPALPDANAKAAVWETGWSKLSALSKQVICDLAGLDPKKLNLAATATRKSLVDGRNNWPANLYASGQGASDPGTETGWTCSVFVGETLCQAARGLGLSNALFLRKDKGPKFKFIAAQNMRTTALFSSVPKADIITAGSENTRDGYIVSMLNGQHVEIVTHIENDTPAKYFCAIGAGRGTVSEIGQELCGGLLTSHRDIEDSENVFLRINADNATIKTLLAKIKN
ncbi:MAG TPA: hypothetical protein VNZ48_09490 [Xanthobacteraceae bacterium]|jgi:hypothetical protein|nr:hypothetical protein [Xanthobacteraceae bacterium]